MAKLTKEEFIKSLKEMNIKEVMELVEAMKEEFGIDPAAVAVAGNAAEEESSEPTEVSVILKAVGSKPIPVIKVVKELMGVGIMDAQKIVKSAPTPIKENIKLEEAEDIKAKLIEAGAEVEIS